MQIALGLKTAVQPKNPIFADGTIALAFDAANALYQVGDKVDVGGSGSVNGVPYNLRCFEMSNSATGLQVFNGRHGMAIVSVDGDQNQHPKRVSTYKAAPRSATCSWAFD